MLNGSCFNNGIPAPGKDLRVHSSMSQSSSFSKSGQVAKWSLILGNMLSWHHMRLAPYSWCFRALQSFHDNHNLHIPTNSWKLMLDLYVFGGPNIACIQAHVSIYLISMYTIYLYIYIYLYTFYVYFLRFGVTPYLLPIPSVQLPLIIPQPTQLLEAHGSLALHQRARRVLENSVGWMSRWKLGSMVRKC